MHGDVLYAYLSIASAYKHAELFGDDVIYYDDATSTIAVAKIEIFAYAHQRLKRLQASDELLARMGVTTPLQRMWWNLSPFSRRVVI